MPALRNNGKNKDAEREAAAKVMRHSGNGSTINAPKSLFCRLLRASANFIGGGNMEDTPLKYDIFSGVPDRDAIWMETVEGLSGALERMEQIAEETAGPYFVFYPANHSVVARMDTSFRLKKSKSSAA